MNERSTNQAIMIDTPDGSFSAYVAHPGAKPAACIVVIQEIFGVNADMRTHCDRLAAQGYIAVCPDLFWRLQPGIELTDRSDSDWQQARSLLQRFDVDQGVQDVAATLAAARTIAGASGKVGVMGFCLGGLLTFLTAARVGADAAVAYYGGGTNKYVGEFAQVKPPMLLHLAQDDEYIPKVAQEAIIAAAEPLDHVQVFTYPGQDHAFARIDGVHYDPEAASLAAQRTERFFKKHLS